MENFAQAEEDSDDSSEHVAGLAEQIAQAMLQDDDDENLPESIWNSQMRANVQGTQNFKAQMSHTALPQESAESEAMQLLYKELLRVNMNELLAAQQRSYYQISPFSAAPECHQLAFHKGLVSNIVPNSVSEQYHNLKRSYKQYHVPLVQGREWASLRSNEGQTRLRYRADHAICGFVRSNDRSGMGVMISDMPPSRNSSGTGVFLPRSRAGSHPVHPRNMKQKPVLPAHMFQAPKFNIDNTLLGTASERVISVGFKKEYPSASTLIGDGSLTHTVSKKVEENPSFHHPSSYSSMQEVAPNISLPSEWTY